METYPLLKTQKGWTKEQPAWFRIYLRGLLSWIGTFGLMLASAQDYTMQDSISGYQANVGYNSIIDGQPAPPKQPMFTITGAGRQNNGFQYEANIGYTPATKGFFRNTLLAMVVPTLNVGEGITDFERSVSASWLQRWQYEHQGKPTIATMVSIQVPYAEPNAKTDIVSTLIITKNIGKKGVAYFNTYAESTRGFTTTGLGYGTLLGYKFFLPKQKEFFLDALLQSGNTVTLEAALEFDLPKGWSVSPGANLAIDTRTGKRTFGGGLLVFYQTSKPLGKKNKP